MIVMMIKVETKSKSQFEAKVILKHAKNFGRLKSDRGGIFFPIVKRLIEHLSKKQKSDRRLRHRFQCKAKQKQ